MTDITTARGIAGPRFEDMADSEVVGTLAKIEKLIRRQLRTSEHHMYIDALAARRDYLEKQAGKPQPKFSPEMYGTPSYSSDDIKADSNEQGEG